MADFRIDTGFFGHIKTKRLRKRLGLEGVFALQMLWAYAALHEHDESRIYAREDIELAVDWDGDGDLVGTLTEVGYLDAEAHGFKIHQWEIHNGYAATAAKRSEAGRIAANKRWESKRICENNANALGTQCAGNANAMRNDAKPNAPSPSPVPDPVPGIKEEPPISPKGDEGDAPLPDAKPKRKQRQAKMQMPFEYSDEFEAAWSAYPRRERKGAAWTAWEKAIKRNMPIERMVGIITARKSTHDWTKDGGRFAPHMASWLNQNGWEDEISGCASDYDNQFAGVI